ncbi:MAG: NAD-dependent protein deacetylase [Saprospiraceae bacterium]
MSVIEAVNLVNQPDLIQSIDVLAALMRNRRFTVLTGAGVSTDSGIPDYRGPKTKHIERNPVKHDEFVNSPEARQRYWSRASRGYANVGKASPNATHQLLAGLEAKGRVHGVITQNVDGLHQAGGSRQVIELHGSLHRVCCLACAKTYDRDVIQSQINAENPGWIRTAKEIAPDGDAEVAIIEQAAFQTPLCASCRGDLMPDVVFFGGSVPKPRSQAAFDLVTEADGLLVLGSSLTVFSGYRFVRHADRLDLPIGIVTLGETRGDKHARVKVDAPLAEVMAVLAEAL